MTSLPQIAGLEDGCRILGYKRTADCMVDLARKLKAGEAVKR